jgi:hypothetical protein
MERDSANMDYIVHHIPPYGGQILSQIIRSIDLQFNFTLLIKLEETESIHRGCYVWISLYLSHKEII